MRSAEEHFATDHSNKGSITQYILRILGLMPANHRDSTGHKFPEVIAGRTQHPELGRCKARIVFGHGHAAGTDVAGDGNSALCHCIGAAIARITVNDNLGAGIQPAHII